MTDKKKQYEEGYYQGARSTQDQARGDNDRRREQQRRDREFRDRMEAAFRQQQERQRAQELEQERQRQRERERKRAREEAREQDRQAQARRQAEEQARSKAHLAKQGKQESRGRKWGGGTKSSPKKPSANQWNWGAAIIAFFIGTGAGTKYFKMEQNAAFVFGGIVGVVFGYYYRQIIILGVLGFIAYALLKNK